jgi:hypothetical protein
MGTQEYLNIITVKVNIRRALENNPREVVKELFPKEFAWYTTHEETYARRNG